MISKYKSQLAKLLIQQVIDHHQTIAFRGNNGQFDIRIVREVRNWGKLEHRVQIVLYITNLETDVVRASKFSYSEAPTRISHLLRPKCLKEELYAALCQTDGLMFPI